jgi:hypothetical protein
MKSTVKYAVNVVPETVCVAEPPPSLPLIVISYSSTGLFPGAAAFQVATIVSVVPLGSGTCQYALRLVGADGATVAALVVKFTGVDAGPVPPIVVLSTVIL